ncbi:hypothetical protein DUNSADRAFT_8399 [Dunaliella salina]|uniref:Encoded protein n=1 Tax=Dunaliella salina TaxID=3046 RepID=A0ABQ7GJN2_DUNSA|nr:hypothetical protein DUNSADRAFT_8399 [Dunaliella salina]|eukprot:KAF5834815.1 hypothetical protein DUNSADRAFT_8399 [Dunaliella salina]
MARSMQGKARNTKDEACTVLKFSRGARMRHASDRHNPMSPISHYLGMLPSISVGLGTKDPCLQPTHLLASLHGNWSPLWLEMWAAV